MEVSIFLLDWEVISWGVELSRFSVCLVFFIDGFLGCKVGDSYHIQ